MVNLPVFAIGVVMASAGWFMIVRDVYPTYRDLHIINVGGWLFYGLMALVGPFVAVMALAGQIN